MSVQFELGVCWFNRSNSSARTSIATVDDLARIIPSVLSVLTTLPDFGSGDLGSAFAAEIVPYAVTSEVKSKVSTTSITQATSSGWKAGGDDRAVCTIA